MLFLMKYFEYFTPPPTPVRILNFDSPSMNNMSTYRLGGSKNGKSTVFFSLRRSRLDYPVLILSIDRNIQPIYMIEHVRTGMAY